MRISKRLLTSSISVLACATLLASCSSTISRSLNVFSWNSVRSPSTGSFKVGNPYRIDGVYYTPKETYDFTQRGIASWYGPNFHGKLTANGEIYDQNALTAAHKTLQLPSIVRVTNLENGRSIIVRVNDRGPYSRGRILDMSKRGAELLQYKNKGTAKIKLQVLGHESRLVAEAAKKGINVSGVEIALNQGKTIEEFFGTNISQTNEKILLAADMEQPPQQQEKEIVQIAPLDSVDRQNLPEQKQETGLVDSTVLQAPDIEHVPSVPITDQQPKPLTASNTSTAEPKRTANDIINELTNTPKAVDTDIFIQAGSFSSKQNAEKYAQDLAIFGKNSVTPVNINDTIFYRVRIGPVETVNKADGILETMKQQGKANAIIVVGD